jgi:hypothetical protein
MRPHVRPHRIRRLALVVVATLLAATAVACNDPATEQPAGRVAPAATIA